MLCLSNAPLILFLYIWESPYLPEYKWFFNDTFHRWITPYITVELLTAKFLHVLYVDYHPLALGLAMFSSLKTEEKQT